MTELNAARQNALRLLQMVGELHKSGYERVRICPGMSPSGMHWRCSITHARNVQQNGWRVVDDHKETLGYSSSQEDHYFGWTDAAGKSATELAKMFVERCPEITDHAKGGDPAYVDWFKNVLEQAQQGNMPVFFADYPLEHQPGDLPPEAKHSSWY